MSSSRKGRYTIKNITLCDRCGEAKAELDCQECKVAFCQECADDIHQFGKWVNHHLKEREIEVKIDPKDESDKHARLRKAVINEIISTERDYLSNLDVFQKIFITPIKTGKFPELKQAPKPTGNLQAPQNVDILVIFSTVEDIAKGSKNFLKDLEMEVKKDDPVIGKVFLNQLDALPLYSVFCNHQNDAQTIIKTTESKSKEFRKFLETCMEHPEVKGLKIFDYIVKPFQRITRYPLLLKQLIEHTDSKHPDHKPLSDALVQFETEVNTLNKNKAGADNLRKLLEIHSVEGLPKEIRLLDKSFVKEGFLRKISKNKDQERYFYLLKDMLLYCAKSLPPRSNFTFRGVIELPDLLIEDVTDTNSLQNAIQLTNKLANKTYIVYAQTPQEKASWLRELELTKEELTGNRKTLYTQINKNSLSSRNIKKPVKALGVRPIWKPDEAVDNCMKCSGKFTVKNRKHHCRKCGNIFCEICSNFKEELPREFEYKGPQKVCVDCHKELEAKQIQLGKKVSASNLIVEKEETFKVGYLVKKGHKRKNWTRRYFVMSKGILYYYQDEKAAGNSILEKSSKPAKGAIVLQDYTFYKPDNQPYKFTFQLKGKKDFLIRAEDQREYDSWSNAFLSACGGRGSLDYFSD